MKYVYNIVKEYLQAHFNFKLYAATIIFTAVLLYFNFKYDIEDGHIDKFYKTPWHTILFFLYHGIPYYITLVFVYLFTDNKKFFSNKRFWLLSLLGLFILALDRGFYHQLPALVDRRHWQAHFHPKFHIPMPTPDVHWHY